MVRSMDPVSTEHSIEDLRRIPGELSFKARIGGQAQEVWLRSDTTAVPAAEAALAVCLMPAMRHGGNLRIEQPLSPRLLRTAREFEAIQRAWSLQRELGDPPLLELAVQAPAREWKPREPTGRVAATFSGGVDSWSTVLHNPDITDLIFLQGFDLVPQFPQHVKLAPEVESRLREAAGEMGLGFHVLRTNARELSDPLVSWERYFSCLLIAAGLFFEPLFDRVLIAGDTEYEVQDARGGNRLTPRLWSTESVEICDDGGRFTRMERTVAVGGHPVVRKSLRVCWKNPGGAYNCGHCTKCLMAWASLVIAGHRDLPTFPGELDVDALAGCEIRQPASLMLREEVLEVAEANQSEILPQMRQAVERGRRDLGLPSDQRVRPDPATLAPRREPLDQEIADLRAAPGELSFEARIGAEAKRIWFRTATPVTPPADAALAACLMPAMRHGGSLRMSDPVSPRVLRNQREFGAVQRAFSRRWELPDDPLEEVEVSAPERAPAPRPPTGRVAAFFSGGIDSWAAVLDTPELTDLIFVRGLDLRPAEGADAAALTDEVQARLQEAADELGLELHVVETNVRELSDPLLPWEAYFACPLAAIALFFEPLFDRVLISGDADYEAQGVLRFGAIWTVDQLWSSERVEIVDACGRLSREQRTELAVGHPAARRTLRVCWRNPDGAYNCGHCSKCLRTMISCEARGIREQMTSFPTQLELGDLDELKMTLMVQLVLWEDTLEVVRQHGRRDLETPVARYVRRGKQELGLPPGFMVRDHGPRGRPRPLLADEATAAVLAEARSVAILIGGYDGSGNFGDLAQLEAALELLAPLSEGLLVLPVIELGASDSHESPAGSPVERAGPVLVFDPEGEGAEGLAPVGAPERLAFGAIYLYGGGYLNPAWGERKLEALAAAEALLVGAAHRTRVATGLQVDPEWQTALGPRLRWPLDGFELLGARDPASESFLRGLGTEAEVLASGDDAVAVLAAPPPQSGWPPMEGPLRLNLHFVQHPWVSDDPEGLFTFYAGLLSGIAKRTDRRLLVQPLIAYQDPRVDERPGLARLGAVCREGDIELAEPLLLRTGSLAAAAEQLAAASLTISCSYHVALSALLLGVPTALITDNDYYTQKASGLSADFGLPTELSLRSGEDPAAAAEWIAAVVLDPERGSALRADLRERACAVHARRRLAETKVLARFSAGALATLASGNAVYRAELLASERRGAAALESMTDAHQRLDTVLSSRSWRLTEPLRRGAARLRRRRRA